MRTRRLRDVETCDSSSDELEDKEEGLIEDGRLGSGEGASKPVWLDGVEIYRTKVVHKANESEAVDEECDDDNKVVYS